MLLGSEVFLKDSQWIKKTHLKKVGYLGNSASVTQTGMPVLNLLLENKDINISALFSPQHGFFGHQQANMITTEDGFLHNKPCFSLYSSKTRRLTPKMKDSFDVLLVDLQDVGCRIYTYLTTLFYLIEDCEKDKTLFILDRPNPLGRYIEGVQLDLQFKSFVGHAPLPMSHGFTLGEAALWFKEYKKLKTDVQVIPLKDYKPQKQPWPSTQPWVEPSPNMTSLTATQCYPGTVLLEGTTLSEGRGTTKPLERFGHPQMNQNKVKKFMMDYGGHFLQGCFLNPCSFEPCFDKFKNEACLGFQIYLDPAWREKGLFRPFRLISLFLKAFHHIHPSIPWKLNPPYEYEYKKLPIDIISGSESLKHWIENSQSTAQDWDNLLCEEESQWKKQSSHFYIY